MRHLITFLGLLATGAAYAAPLPAPAPSATLGADFRSEAASVPARRVADWVAVTGDNHRQPFVIIDKAAAKVFVFAPSGTIIGAAPALLGLSLGDDSVPGIGTRKLATIRPAERTTPAGRFKASLGRDFDQDILWVDYASALSLHRVIVGKAEDHRKARLASPSALDNRISYGCINVSAAFYDGVVAPAFKGTVGVVYILPEQRSAEQVFGMHRSNTPPAGER
jgi:hypothetical protein